MIAKESVIHPARSPSSPLFPATLSLQLLEKSREIISSHTEKTNSDRLKKQAVVAEKGKKI